MAKLLAAWGTYASPEMLCIKGKKWHEVIHEKERMTQHDSLQEGQGCLPPLPQRVGRRSESHLPPLPAPNSLLSTYPVA